jgi:hypothetical protein
MKRIEFYKRYPKTENSPQGPRHRGPNRRELHVKQLAMDRGYEALKAGWPDFLLYRESDGKTVFLEVKSKKDKLNPAQVRMRDILKKIGLNWQIIYVD